MFIQVDLALTEMSLAWPDLRTEEGNENRSAPTARRWRIRIC